MYRESQACTINPASGVISSRPTKSGTNSHRFKIQTYPHRGQHTHKAHTMHLLPLKLPLKTLENMWKFP